MIEIKSGEKMHIPHVLSFTGKMTQSEVSEKLQMMLAQVKEKNILIADELLYAIYSTETINNKIVNGYIAILPISQKTNSFSFLNYHKDFVMENVFKVSINDFPANIDTHIEQIKEYLQEHNLIPLSPTFQKMIKPATDNEDKVCLELYIDVKEKNSI